MNYFTVTNDPDKFETKHMCRDKMNRALEHAQDAHSGHGRKGTVTDIKWPIDASVFEKLNVWPSIIHHLAGGFKFLHSGARFSWGGGGGGLHYRRDGGARLTI